VSRFIRRLIDVRPGEGRLVFEGAASLFGLIAAHTLLETARDALFLGRLPPSRLTFVYALLAVLAVGVARSNARFVRAFGRRNALIFTLFAAAHGTVMLYLVPGGPVTYFILYVWSGLLGSVLVVQFWMFVGQRFTVAQGKRLFGPLAAGGVLGAVTGAGFAVPMLRVLATDDLLIAAAGLFLLTALGLTGVRGDPPGQPVASANRQPLSTGLGLFKEHPYLAQLALLVGLATATVLSTDYLFKSVVAATFPAEDLGEFFASYYAALNAVALVVQVFVAQAVVRKGGVVGAFLVLPMLLIVGLAGTLATQGAVLAVLVTKGADGTLRHSLHRISTELLWMPVPEHVRTKSKVFIDTVVVRGTQGLSAALLLGITGLGYGSPPILAALTGLLAISWLAVGMKLRRPYLELFRRALQSRASGTRRADDLRLSLDNVGIVLEALSSREPAEATAAIQLLASSDRAALIPALVLYHEADEVLLAALKVIATEGRKDWRPLATMLLEHDHEDVRIGALAALSRVSDASAVESRMLDVSPRVRAHAAYWLAEASPEPPESHPAVRSMLNMSGKAGCDARFGLLEAVEEEGRQRWADIVLITSNHPNEELVVASTHAMAKVPDVRFIPHLIQRLRFRAGREAVREAIVQLGAPALDALEEALNTPQEARKIRRHIPRTISRFNSQRAVDILTRRLSVEANGRVRYKILRGLGRLITGQPLHIDAAAIEEQAKRNLLEHLRMAALWLPLSNTVPAQLRPRRAHDLLVGLLEDKVHQALERAFRLLQLVHRQEDLRTTLMAIVSDDREAKAHALEFLDALTLDAKVPEIRTLLRLIVDDLPWQERLQRAAGYIDIIPKSEQEALDLLALEDDVAVAAIAQSYRRTLEQPDQTLELTLTEEVSSGTNI
jgi:AAA family ATP:ADP antiporter